MSMAEQLSEKSHQGFAAQNPPCIGLESDLSRNLCWGCRHVYDETPVDLAVYVRNDPVNLVDPDGRFVTTVVTVEADDPWFWYDRLPNIRSSKTFAMKRIGPGRGIEKSDKDIRSREVTRFKYFVDLFVTVNKLDEITDKKSCKEVLDNVFSYIVSEGIMSADSANITYLLSLSGAADYKIFLAGDAATSESGTIIADILGLHGDKRTHAFVEGGINDVWLDQSLFGSGSGSLASVLIHEMFHLFYGISTGTYGFGLSEAQLATGLGVFTEGMTDAQASAASTELLEEKCK